MKPVVKTLVYTLTLLAVVTILTIQSGFTAEKLPPEQAGTINPPTGQIAFIRDGNIYTMNANGGEQQMICESVNANGKLDWSPDNKTIVFTRSGIANANRPDNLGGTHKLYDLFLCFMDSAYANNRQFWLGLTNDVGSRYPEWNRHDSLILFYKDIYSNFVNTVEPNYQLATIDGDGNYFKYVRKDWQNLFEYFLITPSKNKNGDIVCVFFDLTAPRSIGSVVLPAGNYEKSMEVLKEEAKENESKIAPSWSPDGKYIAYINSKMDKSGIYLATPDFSKDYLVTIAPVGTYLNTVAPSFSPDGKWLTFSTTDGSIWIVDITGNGLRRLSGPGKDKFPAWSK